ncbi:MAG: hypothetical protein AAB276_00315 [Pseudomonadota bacterium]
MTDINSIKTSTPSPGNAAFHHVAQGVMNVGAGAFTTVGAVIGTGVGVLGVAVASMGAAGAAAMATTVVVIVAGGAGANRLRDETKAYANDISNNVANRFNLAGRILAVAIPVTLAAAVGYSVNLISKSAADGAKPPINTPPHVVAAQPHVVSGITNDNCKVTEMPNATDGKRVFELSKGCKLTLDVK